MSNRRDRQDRLLAETLGGEWNEGAPARLAQCAAAHARRSHRNRRVLAACAGATVLVLAGLTTFRPATTPAPRPVEAKPSARGYEIISDAELLSTLRDRPVAVVKRTDGSSDFLLVGEEIAPAAVFEE